MKISDVRITNFRSIRDFHLQDAPDLVVLAGPNGTGKSTVLEAIALWKEIVAPYYSQRNVGVDAVSEGAERAEIAVTVTLTEKEADFCRRELQARGQADEGPTSVAFPAACLSPPTVP